MSIKAKFLKIVNVIIRDNIYMYSAQASFYIIISSIPFIMLLLSLSTLILPVTETDLMLFFEPFVPDIFLPSFKTILHEIFSNVSGSVISFSAISSIWTASRGVQAIERGTRGVYHAPPRPFIIGDILASFMYTFIFILIMIVFLVLFVFGNAIISFLELKSWFWLLVFSRGAWLKWVFVLILLTFCFSGVYMAFSGKKVPLKNHVHGAIFTTLIWMSFSYLFSFYIENFANYSYIYGSLAAIVLIMFWVYCCMIIFLIGGEINVYIINKNENRRRKRRERLAQKEQA